MNIIATFFAGMISISKIVYKYVKELDFISYENASFITFLLTILFLCHVGDLGILVVNFFIYGVALFIVCLVIEDSGALKRKGFFLFTFAVLVIWMGLEHMDRRPEIQAARQKWVQELKEKEQLKKEQTSGKAVESTQKSTN